MYYWFYIFNVFDWVPWIFEKKHIKKIYLLSYSIECPFYIMHECWNLWNIWNFSSAKIEFKFVWCPSPASSNCAALPRLSGGKRKQSSAMRWTLKPRLQLPTETSWGRMRTILSRICSFAHWTLNNYYRVSFPCLRTLIFIYTHNVPQQLFVMNQS